MNAITATQASLVAALLLASSFAASEPKDAPTDRVFIGSSRLDAPACASVSQEFLTRIPDSERLDRRFKGAIDGIEIKRVSGSGHGHFSYVYYALGGGAVTYRLYATGGGRRLTSVPIGLMHNFHVCIDGKPGWIEVHVYAHIIRAPQPPSAY